MPGSIMDERDYVILSENLLANGDRVWQIGIPERNWMHGDTWQSSS